MHSPIPVEAHANGLDSSRNRPTLNASPESADALAHESVVTFFGAIRTGEEKIKSNYNYKKSRKAIRVIGLVVSHFWGGGWS
jgi:hypothetical protein